jgi:[NiFe] hydrogenase diaphorase moiety large subunit
MSEKAEHLEKAVREICRSCGDDRGRMMDIVRAVQERFGCVSSRALDLIAAQVGVHRVEVESVVSFYGFLSQQPKGDVVIRVSRCVPCLMNGAERVAGAFAEALGVEVGQTTPDGRIRLEYTACIGMCDQSPAALIDGEVFTYISGDRARRIVRELREQDRPAASKLVHKFGDGNNAGDLVRSMVHNNIRQEGPVIFGPVSPGEALHKALSMTPQEVIRDMKTARLRGRGGAGFPTGMKWDFTRQAAGETKYVICNADEGEPGTFKDRVILTERAELLFEGMTIAGYAIGAQTGLLYLRAEYGYLQEYLQDVLRRRREAGLLGRNVGHKKGFDFDIRIQMGAGAYICGEETALISSCEGLRGDPKNRPPFPAQKGYQSCPTTVNNVETLCCVARILERGSGWFAEIGSQGSPGTKLLSVSGDCSRPGVYELPFGIRLSEVLRRVGAEDPIAVQVGGPSGQMVSPADFERTICYDDLATGGSVIVFGPKRDLLGAAAEFMQFFIEESCGYCAPCRVGNVLLKERLDRIRAGQGVPGDLEYLEALGRTVRTASRCGLGQTSPNPILTTLSNFRELYEAKVAEEADGLHRSFDLHGALADAESIAGRKGVHAE